MADIVLTHSAKGTTWSKDGASYIKREKKNGKWVYTYQKLGKFRGNGQHADMTNATPTSKDVSERQKLAKNVSRTYSNKGKIQSEAESMKRKSVSAQRNVQRDVRYKLNAKTAYLKNKASRNINKGKKKVSELLERLKKNTSASVAKAKKKATYASKARAQRKSKRTIAREEIIGKVKKSIKNARSGEVNGYYRNNTAKTVSKNAIKKNAGKKR